MDPQSHRHGTPDTAGMMAVQQLQAAFVQHMERRSRNASCTKKLTDGVGEGLAPQLDPKLWGIGARLFGEHAPLGRKNADLVRSLGVAQRPDNRAAGTGHLKLGWHVGRGVVASSSSAGRCAGKQQPLRRWQRGGDRLVC